MRSFARDLGMDPSNLSKIFSGKSQPKLKTQAKILIKLGLKPKEIERVLAGNNELETSENYFDQIDEDHFLSTSEWYYDAILELTRLRSFKPELKWISVVLDIPETKVKLAVERLQRMGLLVIDDSGVWSDNSGNVTSYEVATLTSEARRHKQKALLAKSITAVESISIQERDHSSTTLCVQVSDIEEVKKRIRAFRKSISKFLERSESKPNQVYQLQISFFPLTKIKENLK